MRRVLITFLTLSVAASAAQAQIVQSVNKFTTPGEPEQNNVTGAEAAKSDKGITLLSQAGAEAVDSETTQIGLQALDLWMSRKSRFYARLTLPIKEKPAVEEKSEDGADTTTEAPKLSDSIIKQLVDPFGGILNLSGGLFTRLGAPGPSAIETDADTLTNNEETKKKLQPEHGLFLDVRGGFKFIDLPNPGARAISIGDSKLNVFYTGIVGLKVIAPLYHSQAAAAVRTDTDLAGGLTLGAYFVANHAADKTQSDVFTDLLKRRTTAFTLVVGVNLPTMAALTFSATPWTNDSRMGKTFVFGFNVIRPKSETEEGRATETAKKEEAKENK